eukprot:TRINITY_DN24061_c0_g1_i1.p1 TRINITY_DN24061_c0_g1~~TRINITY_DN24061_c0_g1_i1.p1  ORF type:complete len:416 (+),score=98.04 TRINITY_DN24061_c0_g1_i1:163-1248(+)
MPLFVWMQHEGEDAEEAAIRVAVPEDAFVSDLVCAAAPFFAFGGARGMTLRASQIQLLGPKGDPLSNREKLSACGIEGGVTVRVRPRPQHSALAPGGGGSNMRIAARPTAAGNAAAPRQSTGDLYAPKEVSKAGWCSSLQFGPSGGPQLPAAHQAPAAALRSRTQEFGPPPGVARPTAASAARADPGRAKQPPLKQEDKPRWSTSRAPPAATPGGSGSVATPPSAPKPKVPRQRAGQDARAAGSEAEGSPDPVRGPLTSPQAAPAQDPPRDWAADFAEFYTLHKPEKLDSVPEKLQRHAGEEKALWAMLLQKYGLTEANWRTEKALPVADSPAVQPVAPPPGAAPDAHQDAADSGGYNQEY